MTIVVGGVMIFSVCYLVYRGNCCGRHNAREEKRILQGREERREQQDDEKYQQEEEGGQAFYYYYYYYYNLIIFRWMSGQGREVKLIIVLSSALQ